MSSLQDMSIDMLEHHRLKVSLQAIHKKLGGASCESYVKAVFDKLLSKLFTSRFPGVDGGLIHHLFIKDSTKVVLSTSGLGGKVISKSIQTQIDLLQGSIAINLREGTQNDQGECVLDLDTLQSDSLYIRDLGYISKRYMQAVQAAGSYYLNRLPTWTQLYEFSKGSFKKISIKTIKRRLVRSGGLLDTHFYVGADKFPARIIVEAVPKEVREKRIKRSDRHNKSHGYNTSEQYRERSGLNIWITNLPDQYHGVHIKNLYRLRWQIELLFKTWKSVLGMQRPGDYNASRVMCELYAKLILASIHWSCCRSLISAGTISLYKVAKIMKHTRESLRRLIFARRDDWLTMWTLIKEKAFEVESKKGRLKTEKLIRTIV